jgi:hypothetical protein
MENRECKLVTTLEKKPNGNVNITIKEVSKEMATRFERNSWKHSRSCCVREMQGMCDREMVLR